MLNRQVGVPTTDIVADTLKKMKGRPAPANNPAGRDTLNPASVAHMILDHYIQGTNYPGLKDEVMRAYLEASAEAAANAQPGENPLGKRMLDPNPPFVGEWAYCVELPCGTIGWSSSHWDNMRAAKNAAKMSARMGDMIHIMHRGVFKVFEKFLSGKCTASGKVVWIVVNGDGSMKRNLSTGK